MHRAELIPLRRLVARRRIVTGSQHRRHCIGSHCCFATTAPLVTNDEHDEIIGTVVSFDLL
jgi:hypothetical protein